MECIRYDIRRMVSCGLLLRIVWGFSVQGVVAGVFLVLGITTETNTFLCLEREGRSLSGKVGWLSALLGSGSLWESRRSWRVG